MRPVMPRWTIHCPDGANTRPFAALLQVEDDVLADAANARDARAFQHRRHLRRRRLQRLRLAAQPDGLNHITGDMQVQAVGYGFDFR